MLSCQENLFLFVYQSYLVKVVKLHYIYVHGFNLQLKMASASVVSFYVSQKEILGIGGGGHPLYLLHPLTSPLSKKKATLKSWDYRILGADSSAYIILWSMIAEAEFNSESLVQFLYRACLSCSTKQYDFYHFSQC